jgi:hypothetical protein
VGILTQYFYASINKEKIHFFSSDHFFVVFYQFMVNIFCISNSTDVSIGGQILKRRKENEKACRFSVHRIVARRMQ